MKKVGYLSKITSKGKTYLYLRKGERVKNVVKKTNIFSFGQMPGALEKMYSWREKPELFPEDLKNQGYNLDDLDEWILTIETKVTSNNKPFII